MPMQRDLAVLSFGMQTPAIALNERATLWVEKRGWDMATGAILTVSDTFSMEWQQSVLAIPPT